MWRLQGIMAEVQFNSAENASWMPIYTQPLHEFKLRDFLTAREIPCYLPLLPEWKIQRVRSAKRSYEYRKIVYRPMFRGYIFARLTPEDKLTCWQSNSVIAFLEVPEPQQADFVRELQTVRMIEELGKENPVEFGSELHEGESFVIESGIFEGTFGRLLKKNRQFLWTVEIECLHSTVAVAIDPSKFKMRKVDDGEK